MKKNLHIFLSLLFLITFLIVNKEIKAQCASANKDTLKVMFYNLLHYPGGCGTLVPKRTDTLKKILQYVKPDVFMVCELETSAGADSILNKALNVNGITYYAKAPFVANQSPGGTSLNNGFFYNKNKLIFKSQDEILTNLRDFNVYKMYGNDASLITGDTVYIDFIVGHFKAGSTAADQASRKVQSDSIRKYVDSYPKLKNILLGADYNVYNSTESGYQTLVASGTYLFNDPISRPGAWNNNAAFSDIHTQCPRSTQSLDCGVTGGLDDRFDQILVTNPVMTGTDSAKYIAGTYKAFGNDNQHFNIALIDAPSNSVVPQNIATALYYMSDHLPVVMNVRINYPTTSSSTMALTVQGSYTTCQCPCPGAVLAVPSGGDISMDGSYSFKWANGPTGFFQNNLCPGTYTVTVTDDKGCKIVGSKTIP